MIVGYKPIAFYCCECPSRIAVVQAHPHDPMYPIYRCAFCKTENITKMRVAIQMVSDGKFKFEKGITFQ